PVLRNLSIRGNTATSTGGGISNVMANPRLTNVLIAENQANIGAGISNFLSSPVLTNTTIATNTAQTGGGGMFTGTGAAPEINNTIIWGNDAPQDANIETSGGSPEFRYSLVQGTGNWQADWGTDTEGNVITAV